MDQGGRVVSEDWWPKYPPIETDERGHLCYELYGQDGTRQAMTLPDTRDNRRFIIWVRQHDRYTPVNALSVQVRP